MANISLLSGAAAVLLILGGASAQNLPTGKDKMPPALQSTTPDKSPAATVPEAATDLQAFPKEDIRPSTQRIEEDGSRDGQCGGPTGIGGQQ